jgi:two-component system chemotaxis response regulator CheB
VLADPPGLTLPVVAVAASAGGLKALQHLVGDLPAGLPAAVLIVQHLDRHSPSMLAAILARRTTLHVREAAHGSVIAPGSAFVAPPDHHLLLNRNGTLSLTQTELVHFVRPSADLLFESAAASAGPRAIAVILSGSGHDGAMGVKAIKKRGGTVIVQAAAEHPGMPEAALATGAADHVVPLAEIAPLLRRLLGA